MKSPKKPGSRRPRAAKPVPPAPLVEDNNARGESGDNPFFHESPTPDEVREAKENLDKFRERVGDDDENPIAELLGEINPKRVQELTDSIRGLVALGRGFLKQNSDILADVVNARAS